MVVSVGRGQVVHHDLEVQRVDRRIDLLQLEVVRVVREVVIDFGFLRGSDGRVDLLLGKIEVLLFDYVGVDRELE